MPAVSILHAPRDEALGEKIAVALGAAGHAATRVSADPAVGDLASVDVEAGAAIVLWTEAAAKLARLRLQAQDAMARGALIPVAVGGARPPGGFEKLPPVDLSGWSGAVDDPRWRFVLEEIQLTQTRMMLEDDPVWPVGAAHSSVDATMPEMAASVGLAEARPVNKPVRECVDDPLFDDTPPPERTEDNTRADVEALPAFLSPPLSAAAVRRGSRRRFKARDVAIGGTVALAGLALASVVLVPVLLPGPAMSPAMSPAMGSASGPQTSIAVAGADAGTAISADIDGEAATFPDPSRNRAENLASVTSAPYASAPDGPALTDPAEGLVSDVASDSQSTDDVADGDAPGVSDDAQPDSDAMENLVASLNAEAAVDYEASSLAALAAMPEELREKTYLGNYFKECVDCPDMAALAAETFRMGAPVGELGAKPAEGPAHMVTIARRFAVGTREVTYAQWDACVADGGCAHKPSDHGWGRGKRPVTSVSFHDIEAYLAWLSAKTGHDYRLPSEAEWEYAARAGTDSAFAYGDRITAKQANFYGQYPYRSGKGVFRKRTTPVVSFAPNGFGLFDMHGNVWEWTSDCWADSHAGAPVNGAPRLTGDCTKRVLKGGAWNTGGWRLRSAHRISKDTVAREFDNGFRVARDLD